MVREKTRDSILTKWWFWVLAIAIGYSVAVWW